MTHFSDNLYLGPVPVRGARHSGPSPTSFGVGPLGRVYIYDIVPAALVANGIATAQAVAGAGNLTLNGSLTSSLSLLGLAAATIATFDVPRCPSVVSSSASDTTQTVTFSGYDVYMKPMTARVTLNGTNTVIATKAFKYVTQVAISGVCVGNISAGSADKFGLPFTVSNVAYIMFAKWDSTLADNAGTFVAADATDPATNLTTDVRGTFVPAGNAANGSRRLVIGIALTAIQCGPDATEVGAYGVAQV